jgi:probable rRNA maturation factor
MYEIELNSRFPFPAEFQNRLQEAVCRVLAVAQVASAEVSLAIVDDSTIHQLNRRHLEHDYATDVLSFVLEEGPDHLEGEIIASWDHARTQAADVGWQAENELMLYVIHGALHLVGFDDHHPDDRRRMREAEAEQLRSWGLPLPSPIPAKSDPGESFPAGPLSPAPTTSNSNSASTSDKADAQERS